MPRQLSPRAHIRALLAALLVGALLSTSAARAQQPAVSQEARQRAHKMLEQVRRDLAEIYYDSTYHGLDMMGAKFHAADSALDSASTPYGMYAVIAQYLADLDDSHTMFMPPSHAAKTEYGFDYQIVGDTAFITWVKKESDAEKKGLKPGDAILLLDKFRLTRSTWRTLNYVYYTLNPRDQLQLLVKSPGEAPRTVDVLAKVRMGDRIIDLDNFSQITRLIEQEEQSAGPRHRLADVGGDSVLVWKLSTFAGGDEDAVDEVMRRVRTHRAVILDLRHNGGGAITTQKYIIGQFIDQDLKYAVTRERKKSDTVVAKAMKQPYNGMLIILVDSYSASSSEMTAYALQAEGRAIVVGDRSMGAVMGALMPRHEVGSLERKLVYGAEVTVEDVVMSDGTRLEKRGVIPDKLVVPTGADIAAGRDPALAKALEIAGVTRTSEQAGRILPKKVAD